MKTFLDYLAKITKEQYNKEVKFELIDLPNDFFDNLKRCDFAGDKDFDKNNPASFCIEPRNESHICTTARCPLIVLDRLSPLDIFQKRKEE